MFHGECAQGKLMQKKCPPLWWRGSFHSISSSTWNQYVIIHKYGAGREAVDTHPGKSNLETLVTLKWAANQGDMNISQGISLPQSVSFFFLTWSSFIDKHGYLPGKSSNPCNIFWLLVQLPNSNCLLLTAIQIICLGEKVPGKFKNRGKKRYVCFSASLM